VSHGLHQAAGQEGKIQSENQTYMITLQNYFDGHKSLMTKLRSRPRSEDHGLDVAVIPTNVPMVRADRRMPQDREEGSRRHREI
jgi:preprotein translocase subunit SecA